MARQGFFTFFHAAVAIPAWTRRRSAAFHRAQLTPKGNMTMTTRYPLALAVTGVLVFTGVASPTRVNAASGFSGCRGWGHTLPLKKGQQYPSYWMTMTAPNAGQVTEVLPVDVPGHPFIRLDFALNGRAVENGRFYDNSCEVTVAWQLGRFWTITVKSVVFQSGPASTMIPDSNHG